MAAEKKINIAFIGTKGIPAKWGGIEKYVEEVGRRLVERGHRVTVFSSRWYSNHYQGSEYKGIRIQRIPSIKLQATDALSNAFYATAAVRKGGYDIAHFHGLASYYFIPFVKKTGNLTVATAHAMESNWDNVKYNRLGRMVIKTAFHIGMKYAHCVTTVARHLKEKILHDYGRNALLLPGGLDSGKFEAPDIIKKKYGLQGRDYLLFLGRIDPIKRMDWALDLARVVDRKTRLVIAGGAQDSLTKNYLNDLKRRARGFPNIIFTGPVSGKEKAELFGNCLMFLAPSQDEGLPLAVLEAISYAKCCIVSDIPAFRSVIENGVSGFMFPKNSKNDFMDTIAKLIHSVQRLDSIGREAKRRILADFDWNNTADKAEMIYRNLLDRRQLF
jgi:glycosyltransferase involved in cell wall biosynthesis